MLNTRLHSSFQQPHGRGHHYFTNEKTTGEGPPNLLKVGAGSSLVGWTPDTDGSRGHCPLTSYAKACLDQLFLVTHRAHLQDSNGVPVKTDTYVRRQPTDQAWGPYPWRRWRRQVLGGLCWSQLSPRQNPFNPAVI